MLNTIFFSNTSICTVFIRQTSTELVKCVNNKNYSYNIINNSNNINNNNNNNNNNNIINLNYYQIRECLTLSDQGICESC